MRIRTAVIPVAGKGTRFQPVTKAVAKELLPLVDTPTLHHIVLEAANSGIEKIVLVTSKGKSSIEDYFDSDLNDEVLKKIQIVSIRQKNPRGLGHAVLTAKPLVENEPFAVLLGDDVIVNKGRPCIGQLMDVFEKRNGSPVVGIMEVPASETHKYGIVSGQRVDDHTILLDKLVEKPAAGQAPSQFAIPGRYILTPDVFPILENAQPGAGGEIQLTDALQALAKKRELFAFQFQGRRFDAGDRFGYLEANIYFALQREDTRESTEKLIKRLAKELL